MNTMTSTAIIVTTAVAWLSACTESPNERSALKVRDSAGVAIVTLSGYDALASLGLSDGSVFERGAQTTDSIANIAEVVPLSAGRMAVASIAYQHISILDSLGKTVGGFGRKGRGPGEFVGIGGLTVLRGDTIAVRDEGRTLLFTLDGRHVKTLTASLGQMGASTLVGQSRSGTYLWTGEKGKFFTDEVGSFDQIADSAFRVFARQGPSDTGLTEILSVKMGDVSNSPPLAWRRFSKYAFHDSLLYHTGAEDDIRAFDETGRLRAIVRPPPGRPVTTADIDQYKKGYLKDVIGTPREPALRTFLARFAYPKTLPPVSALFVAPAGDMWFAETPIVSSDSVRWTIVRASRIDAATVVLPPGLRVQAVLDDGFIAAYTDENGIEHLAKYRLVKLEKQMKR
jgi:hypothetical protein